jgi:hypothetical protein
MLSREGIEVLVSLLTPDEVAELGLSDEERLCNHYGIRFFNFSIPDRCVPDEVGVSHLLDIVVQHAKAGRRVAPSSCDLLERNVFSIYISIYRLLIQRVPAARRQWHSPDEGFAEHNSAK